MEDANKVLHTLCRQRDKKVSLDDTLKFSAIQAHGLVAPPFPTMNLKASQCFLSVLASSKNPTMGSFYQELYEHPVS